MRASKRLICMICFVVVLSLAGNVLADDWVGGGDTDLWSDPNNWDGGIVPTADGTWHAVVAAGCTVANPGQEVGGLVVGYTGGSGDLTIDGGDLHVVRTLTTNYGWLFLGQSDVITGQLYMDSGYLLCDNRIVVGVNSYGNGTAASNIVMTGGTIELGEGSDQGGQGLIINNNGHIQLDGGVITTLQFTMGGAATMDVAGGKLIVDGDVTSMIQNLIDLGQITANYATTAPFLDYDESNAGKTTLKGALECGDWGYHQGDINKDCYVDINDIMELAVNWLDY